MFKLLSTLILILSIVLFPPAALAFVSNNAVPGDSTYPIKRALENVILTAASVNPTTKAWFSAQRSDRRFKEFTTLNSQGKVGTVVLKELVQQTGDAANNISGVKDSGEKIKLIDQLSSSIQNYDKGLQSVAESPAAAAPAPTLPPTAPRNAQPTSAPTAHPAANPDPQKQKELQEQIEAAKKAREEFEALQKRLEEERKKAAEEQRRENRGASATPVPTLAPAPAATSVPVPPAVADTGGTQSTSQTGAASALNPTGGGVAPRVPLAAARAMGLHPDSTPAPTASTDSRTSASSSTSCPSGTVRNECIGYASNGINTYCWGDNNTYLGGICSTGCAQSDNNCTPSAATPAPTAAPAAACTDQCYSDQLWVGIHSVNGTCDNSHPDNIYICGSGGEVAGTQKTCNNQTWICNGSYWSR